MARTCKTRTRFLSLTCLPLLHFSICSKGRMPMGRGPLVFSPPYSPDSKLLLAAGPSKGGGRGWSSAYGSFLKQPSCTQLQCRPRPERRHPITPFIPRFYARRVDFMNGSYRSQVSSPVSRTIGSRPHVDCPVALRAR